MILATHQNPHLDDIAALWLLQRFHPRWKKAAWKFFPANTLRDNDLHDKKITFVGIGRGQFDEHKGDLADCAASLVFKFLLKEKDVKFSAVDKTALQELVAFVNAEDHAANLATPNMEFSLPAAILAMAGNKRPSKETMRFGLEYLDAIFSWLKDKQVLLADWKKAKKIKTPWGTGMAIETTISSRIVMRQAALEKLVLAVTVNPKNNFRTIRARPDSRVDLTAAYKIVKKLEPQAEWYLHHSKKMLLCGSDVAANVYLSKIPLIALARLVTV